MHWKGAHVQKCDPSLSVFFFFFISSQWIFLSHHIFDLCLSPIDPYRCLLAHKPLRNIGLNRCRSSKRGPWLFCRVVTRMPLFAKEKKNLAHTKRKEIMFRIINEICLSSTTCLPESQTKVAIQNSARKKCSLESFRIASPRITFCGLPSQLAPPANSLSLSSFFFFLWPRNRAGRVLYVVE